MIEPARRIPLTIWLIPVGITFLFLFAALWLFAVQQMQRDLPRSPSDVFITTAIDPPPIRLTDRNWTRIRVDDPEGQAHMNEFYFEFYPTGAIQYRLADGRHFIMYPDRRQWQYSNDRDEWLEYNDDLGTVAFVDVTTYGQSVVDVRIIWQRKRN